MLFNSKGGGIARTLAEGFEAMVTASLFQAQQESLLGD
jgi:hypothetical protein